MDRDIKSGLPLCRQPPLAAFKVTLGHVRAGNHQLPIVVYTNGERIDTVIVHVHGGPRQQVGIIEPLLLYGKPAPNIAFVKPVYSGSANRTNYPSEDYSDALHDIRATIAMARASGRAVILSSDSAGSLLLHKACGPDCPWPRVAIAPMAMSPAATTRLAAAIYSCNANSSHHACVKDPLFNVEHQHFDNITANRIISNGSGGWRAVQMIVDGDNQSSAFFGAAEYFAENSSFLAGAPCTDVIFDPRDPIIGAKRIEVSAINCPGSLHRVEDFRHPSFNRKQKGIDTYWAIIAKFRSEARKLGV